MKILKFIICYVVVKYLCRYRKFREKYISFLYYREIEKQKYIYNINGNSRRHRSEKIRF
jgi:hypothetical protein